MYDPEYRILKSLYRRTAKFILSHIRAAATVAAACVMTAVFLTGALSFGYDAFIGNRFIGTVSGRAETEAVLSEINAQLAVPIKEELRLYPRIITRKMVCSDKQIEAQIKLSSGQMHEGTAFIFDNEVLFAMNGSEEMHRLIDEYTAPYRTPDTTSAVLEGNILYEEGVYPDSLFLSPKEARSFLNEKKYNVLTSETVTETEILERPVQNVENGSKYVGEVEVTSEGSDGENEITKIILKRNGETVSEECISENLIALPAAKIIETGTLVPEGAGSGIFTRPVSGSITSGFGMRWGRMHNGTDFAGSVGENVMSADSGTVRFAGDGSGYGNLIIIDHKNGYETYYAHLSKIYVSAGEKIKRGQVIGAVGTTGNSTGPHLHFEIRENSVAKNPMQYLAAMPDGANLNTL